MQQNDRHGPVPLEAGPASPCARLLARANQRFATQVEAVLPAGITLDQWSVLDHLLVHQQSSMSELSAALGISGPTLTRVVDVLTQKVLTYRNVDPVDRRRVLVYLSTRGRALAEVLQPEVKSAERQLLVGLAVDEVADLARLLEHVVGARNQLGIPQ